jgi:hypothetical protein
MPSAISAKMTRGVPERSLTDRNVLDLFSSSGPAGRRGDGAFVRPDIRGRLSTASSFATSASASAASAAGRREDLLDFRRRQILRQRSRRVETKRFRELSAGFVRPAGDDIDDAEVATNLRKNTGRARIASAERHRLLQLAFGVRELGR